MQNKKTWAAGDKIGYLKDKAPDFRLSEVAGEHRRVSVPDTLDLQQRAMLGLNVLTEAVDPLADYEQYFRARFNRNPPTMYHDFSDVCDVKFLESLPLLRVITGSNLNEHVEKGRLSAYLRMIGPDGLVWEPKKGRPWIEAGISSGGVKGDFSSGDCFCYPSIDIGRFLGVISAHCLLTGDTLWKQIGDKMIEGTKKWLIYRDDYAFFPKILFGPDTVIDQNAPMVKGLDSAHSEWVIQGLAQFHRVTGSEEAIDLAGKLVCGFRHHGEYFGPDAEFISDHPHHHCHVLGLLAMADYALEVGDKELLEFTRKGYEVGRSLGIPMIGYFPEVFFSVKPDSTCEACEVADMIALGIKLSQAGVADYWDDVDRYIRNHFAEMQLTETDWIYEYTSTLEPTPIGPYETEDRVPERNLGGFAGWSSINEWRAAGPGIMHCCTGNATRAIYYAWEGILEYKEGVLKINMLLNRGSKWADINSYIPYEGRVDIHIKKDCNLKVRIPEWVLPGEVLCTVQDKQRVIRFEGRYAQIGETRAGDTVIFTFPIRERTEHIKIAEKEYSLAIKGNDVMEVDPPGKVGPLYKRAHYRENKARWNMMERFICQNTFRW